MEPCGRRLVLFRILSQSSNYMSIRKRTHFLNSSFEAQNDSHLHFQNGIWLIEVINILSFMNSWWIQEIYQFLWCFLFINTYKEFGWQNRNAHLIQLSVYKWVSYVCLKTKTIISRGTKRKKNIWGRSS